MNQKKRHLAGLHKNQLEKQGFLLEISPGRYLLGEGPFCAEREPAPGKWSLFHPPFFFFPPFQKNKKPYWYIPSVATVFSKKELLAFLPQQKLKSPPLSSFTGLLWKKPHFNSFQEVFFKIKEQIKKNNIQKAVPVFFETADFPLDKKNILTLIHLLIAGSNESHGVNYAFWSGAKALIGRTPEYLFRKQGLYVQTMALAGTARGGGHNLLKDPKEKWEHKLVVKQITNLLHPLGDLRKSSSYIYSTGKLRHLRTDFKLKLKKDISFQKLCLLLHPTPALGGFPRSPALKLLFDLQEKTSPRFFFGAPFGVVKGDKAFCVVAIRNVQFNKDKAYIGSGSGLVKESQIAREWQELSKKRRFIKDILF